jgi:hypothetical protein
MFNTAGVEIQHCDDDNSIFFLLLLLLRVESMTMALSYTRVHGRRMRMANEGYTIKGKHTTNTYFEDSPCHLRHI